MSVARPIPHNQQGSTLVEVLIAATVVVLVLVSIVSMMSLVLRNQRASSGQQQATKYAHQAVEWVRQVRDNVGWQTFYDTAVSGTHCIPIIPASADVASYNALADVGCSGAADYVKYGTLEAHTDPGNFFRRIDITRTPPDQVQIVATVTWTEGTKTLDSTATLILRKWR